jgi:hypothetical protein
LVGTRTSTCGRTRAAERHEQAAELLDEHGLPERAQSHRQAAEQDRDAAHADEQAAEAE